ncbi:hypothetical protein SAMN04489835_1423 [Mycolicibacterium rutilum]|uniref:Uncharacterized protein n=1 Tax=Mycolicibacterium rutilum TaxID=370526 RepID=A0A1H6JAE3_MYCRU|nr:hypothetical protein [Mycolicibacterium rutilum]SEH55941.1 hypothetical protein SAMN04489835_1423 [Mycolicibacterium rutilum]
MFSPVDFWSVVDDTGRLFQITRVELGGLGSDRWIGEVLNRSGSVADRVAFAFDIERMGDFVRYVTASYSRAMTEEMEKFNDLRKYLDDLDWGDDSA